MLLFGFSQVKELIMEIDLNFKDLPVMTYRCDTCYGTGQVDTFGAKKKKVKTIPCKLTCSNCNGRGKHLTEFGTAILNLVKEWSDVSEIENMKEDILSLKRECDL